MKFLENLDFLLKSHNMKRAELARAIHVAPSTINSWFARDTDKVKISALSSIAEYFNVSLEWLINGDNDNKYNFNTNDFTKEELELISNFAQMLKGRRKNDK